MVVSVCSDLQVLVMPIPPIQGLQVLCLDDGSPIPTPTVQDCRNPCAPGSRSPFSRHHPLLLNPPFHRARISSPLDTSNHSSSLPHPHPHPPTRPTDHPVTKIEDRVSFFPHPSSNQESDNCLDVPCTQSRSRETACQWAQPILLHEAGGRGDIENL